MHSPFSGQGLNLGLGDAMNLGWKLAAVVTGRSPVGLLDTYTNEWHPVGAWVLDWTRAQVALMRPDDKVGAVRDVLADLVGTRDGMTHMVAEISGVARRIPDEVADADNDAACPLVGRTVPDLTLQDGQPLRNAFTTGQFVLAGPTAPSDLLPPWTAPVTAVTTRGHDDTMLARPDGGVVWTGERRTRPRRPATNAPALARRHQVRTGDTGVTSGRQAPA